MSIMAGSPMASVTYLRVELSSLLEDPAGTLARQAQETEKGGSGLRGNPYCNGIEVRGWVVPRTDGQRSAEAHLFLDARGGRSLVIEVGGGNVFELRDPMSVCVEGRLGQRPDGSYVLNAHLIRSLRVTGAVGPADRDKMWAARWGVDYSAAPRTNLV